MLKHTWPWIVPLCPGIAHRVSLPSLASGQLSPSTVDSPTAAAEGTSVLMHHLAEELSDLPASPPSTIDMNSRLQSSLLRWRSEDRGKEQWKGVVDVLRVRTQVNRQIDTRRYYSSSCPVDLLPSQMPVCEVVVPTNSTPQGCFREARVKVLPATRLTSFLDDVFLSFRVQLRRSLSMACRPRAKSLGNRPAESALPHGYNSE